MRWSEMFDDLEAQIAAADRADLRAEVSDRTRRERATVALWDRLAAALGASVTLHLAGGATFTGCVLEVGSDWVLLEQPAGRAVLVPAAQVALAEALPRASDARVGISRRRYGIGVVLREIARDRSVVRVILPGDGVVEGRVAGVGSDHVDLVRTEGDLVGRRARPAAVAAALGSVQAVVIP